MLARRLTVLEICPVAWMGGTRPQVHSSTVLYKKTIVQSTHVVNLKSFCMNNGNKARWKKRREPEGSLKGKVCANRLVKALLEVRSDAYLYMMCSNNFFDGRSAVLEQTHTLAMKGKKMKLSQLLFLIHIKRTRRSKSNEQGQVL